MNCKVCGYEVDDQALFCANCGAKIEKEAVQEAQAEAVSETVAGVVGEALEQDVMLNEAVKTADEKLDDMMQAADAAIEEAITEKAEAVEAIVEEMSANATDVKEAIEEQVVEPVKEAIEEQMVGPVKEVVEQVAEPVKEAIQEQVEEPVRYEAEAVAAAVAAVAAAAPEANAVATEKSASEKPLYIVKNSAAVTTFAVILSILLTGVLFVATCIFTLANEKFNDFYSDVIFADLVANIDFWVVTSSWYAIAVYTILVLLILLIFFVLKRRKYAILNYVGIPAIINGLLFLGIGYFAETIQDAFSIEGIFGELLAEIDGSIAELVMFYGLVLLIAGAAAVLIYAIIAIIHRLVCRRRRKKSARA